MCKNWVWMKFREKLSSLLGGTVTMDTTKQSTIPQSTTKHFVNSKSSKIQKKYENDG